MRDIESVAIDLHDALADNFTVEMRDERWKSTIVPKDARFFEFPYPYADKTAMVTIGISPDHSMKLFSNQSITDYMDDEERAQWYNFLRNIRMKVAAPHRYDFDLKNFTKGKMQLRDIVQQTTDSNLIKPEDVVESKLHGTSRSSYQTFENVRIIVRHSKPVQEEQVGSRSRNIQSIFIENSIGERFRLPEGTSINGARAYARHCKNGGTLNDDFGQHIGKIVKEMADLRLFVRNMRGRTFEDAETNAMVEAAINHYGALHRDLFTMRSQRGYEQYKKLWQPEQILQDDFDIESLKERFVKRVFDDRLMDALPVVHRAYQQMKNKVGEEFDAWASQLIAEEQMDAEVKSPFANSIDSGAASDSDMDGSGEDDELAQLFNKNGFDYKFLDGTYWFESKGEVSRAKDILAQAGINWNRIKMGIYNYGYGSGSKYGASTWERDLPNNKGVHESQTLKTLAGIK